ncbi:hypothetical protein [Methyloraptor flagellatus]|jgi:hypothetical protein|uniref:Uncharacterized protein n=1 Tax=Methyloraptor flagellatus TaxID=3162530 RepID=A0AAU7X8W2_9HYPH
MAEDEKAPSGRGAGEVNGFARVLFFAAAVVVAAVALVVIGVGALIGSRTTVFVGVTGFGVALYLVWRAFKAP